MMRPLSYRTDILLVEGEITRDLSAYAQRKDHVRTQQEGPSANQEETSHQKPHHHLDCELQIPKYEKMKFCCSTIQFAVFCYGSPRRLTQ